MGLAASQARFLAITSRKMNCEFQSMQIAQQKLSVTRDLQRAAQDYQNSLNATKLIWDCDTVDNDIYNLSYDLMMNPSAINEYDPYLITDTKGRIVLDNKTWQAAKDAGIINKYGDPIKSNAFNIDGRDAFLKQLGVQGLASPEVIKKITAMGDSGYTTSGVGGEILDKTISSIMNTTAFLNYMKDAKYEEDKKDDGGTIIHEKGKYIFGLNLSGLGSTISNNGLKLSNTDDVSLGNILSGKYTLTFKGVNDDFTKTLETLLESIAKSFGMGSNEGLAVTSDAKAALKVAYALTKVQYDNALDYETINSQPGENYLINQAHKTNTGVVAHSGEAGKNLCTVSITNMVQSFLTNFVIALEGFDCGLNIDKKSVLNSNYVTKYPDYNFQISNKNYPQSDKLYADFYNQLYNQICMNGACNDALKREKVTDNTYLTNALKNGQLFVSTLSTDGYFYQGHYTASGHIAEVTDEDAVAQAEAEYNVTKAKLNNKEETLELQMKNLDMEISSLTTEYDTVKGLISKSVEKVFTMFSS